MSHRKANQFAARAAWVTTCALVLVSTLGCARRNFGNQAVGGYEYCFAASENSDAIVQSMEIFVRRSPSNPTYVELDIRPESVIQAGVEASIYLANQSGQYRVLEQQIPLDAGEEYYLGTFPDTLYESFDFIVVTPFSPGTGFLDADGTYTAVCYRPLLGDGLDQFGNPLGGG